MEEETTNHSPYSVSPTTSSAATTGLDWFSEYPHGTMPKVSMLLQFDQVLSRCSDFLSFALTLLYVPIIIAPTTGLKHPNIYTPVLV